MAGIVCRVRNALSYAPIKSTICSIQTKVQQYSTDTATNMEQSPFACFAKEWWDINGPLKPLHDFNDIRVPFIRNGLVRRGNIAPDLVNTKNVLKGQKILEVNCGGGVLAEQLALLGAHVTGVDPSDELIKVAREHLLSRADAGLRDRIVYKTEPIDALAKQQPNYYDAVIISDGIEHLTDKMVLLRPCVESLKPGGSLFLTTLSKTVAMWIVGIFFPEYIFGTFPKGTHHYDTLISPSEMQNILDQLNCETVLINGSIYDPLYKRWRQINSEKLFYELHAIKKSN